MVRTTRAVISVRSLPRTMCAHENTGRRPDANAASLDARRIISYSAAADDARGHLEVPTIRVGRDVHAGRCDSYSRLRASRSLVVTRLLHTQQLRRADVRGGRRLGPPRRVAVLLSVSPDIHQPHASCGAAAAV